MKFSNHYYGLIAGLPDISKDDRKLPLTAAAFRELAAEELSAADQAVLGLFFLPHDHRQLLRLLDKQAADPGLPTVFTVQQMEEEIAIPDNTLLPYLNAFIADYKEGALPHEVRRENLLSRSYYDYLMESHNAFVREYAEFDMNIRNLTAALNARRHGLEVEREVIGDTPFSQALRNNNSRDFGLAQDYPYVDRVIALMLQDDLIERERGLDILYWEYLEEAVVYDYFTLERVIAFLLELQMVERWSKMSSESGRKVFMEMVERLRKAVEFTEEFKN